MRIPMLATVVASERAMTPLSFKPICALGPEIPLLAFLGLVYLLTRPTTRVPD
jgi:hypothetical protein